MGNHCVRGFCCAGNPLSQTLPGLPAVPEGGASALQPGRGSLSLQTGSASEKGFALLLFSAATPSQLRFAQQLSQGESQGHDGSASCLSLWERWHGVSRDGEGERLSLRGSWHREAMTERVPARRNALDLTNHCKSFILEVQKALALQDGLRLPAAASCLERHSHLAGRGPNKNSLFLPQAAGIFVAASSLPDCQFSKRKMTARGLGTLETVIFSFCHHCEKQSM